MTLSSDFDTMLYFCQERELSLVMKSLNFYRTITNVILHLIRYDLVFCGNLSYQDYQNSPHISQRCCLGVFLFPLDEESALDIVVKYGILLNT